MGRFERGASQMKSVTVCHSVHDLQTVVASFDLPDLFAQEDNTGRIAVYHGREILCYIEAETEDAAVGIIQACNIELAD